MLVEPQGRLLNLPPNPERKQSRKDADEENGTPPVARQDQSSDDRRQRVAHGVATLHQPQGFGAVLGAPGLSHQCRSRCPLASHAQSKQEPKDRELHEASRQPARRSKRE